MYATTPTGKNPKGTVSIITSNGRLQLRFRYLGKRHYLSLGLPDTHANRKLAEMKARAIELDMLSDHLDPTLAKYKLQTSLSTVEPVTPITPSLKQLSPCSRYHG